MTSVSMKLVLVLLLCSTQAEGTVLDTLLKGNGGATPQFTKGGEDLSHKGPWPVEVAAYRYDCGIVKGEMLAEIYTKIQKPVKESKDQATHLRDATVKMIEKSNEKEKEAKAKIAGATAGDKKVHPLDGYSNVEKWQETAEHEEAEAEFLLMVRGNCKTVFGKLTDRNHKINKLIEDINAHHPTRQDIKDREGCVDDLKELRLRLELEVGDSGKIVDDVKMLANQVRDSAKDYNCGIPASVNHVSSQCSKGNTKFSPKCAITCEDGYDGEGTANALRCRKQGKFGKQLYGEWKGMAVCVGRNCGKPPKIGDGNTAEQDIRYPHMATYVCNEGFSQDGSASGPKTFTFQCGVTGHYLKDTTHVCKPIKCGSAPVVKYSFPVGGTYYFPEKASWKCIKGYTTDETPGGIKDFEASCQPTGEFSARQSCNAVRCGPPNIYQNTDLLSPNKEQYFQNEQNYKCQAGYSTNQDAAGPKAFTLECDENGEFIVKGDELAVIPKCRPVSAGFPQRVQHGLFKNREYFYTESYWVSAETGYSVGGLPTEGLTFEVSVTTDGKFSGVKDLQPVICGTPPTVEQSYTAFEDKKITFSQLVPYTCTDGYSTDKTPAEAASTFTVTCESDSSFSAVPGVGHCANIDDCADHTCGPHGDCVDKLLDYNCDCQSGYEETEKDGEKICGNIDDCGAEACGSGTCVDLLNDYKCLCPPGAEQVQDEDGKTCAQQLCGTPPIVENAATTPEEDGGEKAFYPKEITYQCDYGFTLDGTAGGKNHHSIQCVETKAELAWKKDGWKVEGKGVEFTKTEKCQAIKCGDVPDVADAGASAKSAVFSETVKYECATGYTIDATAAGDNHFSTECLATGKFGPVKTCKRVTCGEPDEIANSARPSGSRVFEDKVKYECFEGFTLDSTPDGETSFEIECKDTGKFTKTKVCVAKVCGDPPQDIHAAHATTANEGKVSYPRVTEVTCNDGFTVGGEKGGKTSFLVKCTSSGKFSQFDKRTCQPVQCGKPPELQHSGVEKIKSLWSGGEAGGKILAFGEEATYKCDVGYTTGGESNAPIRYHVECLNNGDFSVPPKDMQCRNVNDCESNSCGPGKCIDEIGAAPAYTCECNFGYDLRASKNGHKHCGNTDDCEGQDCTDNREDVGQCKDQIGDYTCECPAGYYVGEKDGKKTCTAVQCSADTPTLEHGKQVTDNSGPVIFPTTLEYTCDEGYSTDASITEAKKSFQAQCTSAKVLVGVQACQKITCGTVRQLAFTTITSPSEAEKDILYKEKGEYACFEGYTATGRADGDKTFSVECKSDGILTDPKVCEPVRCGPAPTVPKCKPAISGLVTYDMKLEYNCDAGYTLDGLPTGRRLFERKCKKDASFSALTSDQPCKPVTAGKAPVVQHATMTEYAGAEVEDFPPTVFYPNGLEYKCVEGYSEDGVPGGNTKIAVRVNTQGTFTPPLPDACILITYNVKGMIKNAKNGAMLGGVKVRVQGTENIATSEEGFFTLEQVAPGDVTLEYSKNGFITTERTVEVTGHMNTGGPADISMSAVLGAGEWRAVLKWGETPKDLDAYAKWGWSKVCSSQTSRQSNHIKGTLERDVTQGFGPETLHLRGLGDCTGNAGGNRCDIRYEVEDVNGDALLDSDALVTLYTGNSVAGSFKIGDCRNTVSEDGKWWHVFTLDGKENKIKWMCTSGEPAPMNSADRQKFLEAQKKWTAGKATCKKASETGTAALDKIKEGIVGSRKKQADLQAKIDGGYPLKTEHDDKCLDDGGSNVYMHGCHGGDNQKFWFDGEHLKRLGSDHKCLDYNTGNNNVYMYDCHDGDNQKWRLDSDKRLKTKHDEKCLDYNYGNGNVYMHPCHDGKNQKWYLEGASGAAAQAQVEGLSGMSNMQRWKDDLETEKAEEKLYKEIKESADKCIANAGTCLDDAKKLFNKVEKTDDFNSLESALDSFGVTAEKDLNCSEKVEEQWDDASKDYDCGAPPAVNHAASICTNGNTGTSPKCAITCETGYDGEGTSNAYKCRKQGKFGQQVYGEWLGSASCVGRMCGEPPTISKANTAIQDIRFPHAASYGCSEGFSVDESAAGDKAFTLPCGPEGTFLKDASHACLAITCKNAPEVPNTEPVFGQFHYTEVVDYKCTDGHSIDATAGGLKTFSVSCQKTGTYSQAKSCDAVRCGTPPTYPNTKLVTDDSDKYFQDAVDYTCNAGYSLDQKADGSKKFTLVCAAHGEFSVKGWPDSPIPTCGPVSAGKPAAVANGNVPNREMFYGQSAAINAESGYSLDGKLDSTAFTITVNDKGAFDGVKEFVAVACGNVKSVKNGKASATKASFGDQVYYTCDAGYSTDKTAEDAASSFTVDCQADSNYSPLSECLNIDDCADHTCGPKGQCKDKLLDYECECDSGFEEHTDETSGEKLCGNINDCGPEACGVGKCKDLVNGYKCLCPEGYEEETDESGEHTCTRVSCGTPPVVDNTKVVLDFFTWTEASNTKAFFEDWFLTICADGHTLDAKPHGAPSFIISCGASQNWEDVDSFGRNCQPIECNSVPDVKNAKADKTSAVYDQSIEYKCEEGFTTDATPEGDAHFSVTCEAGGGFTLGSQCMPVSCGEPDDIPNANRPSGPRVYEDVVDYECASGFSVDGKPDGKSKFDVECKKNGKFTDLKECKAKECGVPEKNINALHSTSADEGVVRYPHVTEVTCYDGYTVGGDPKGNTSFTVKCTSEGKFEKFDKRECAPVKCGVLPALQNAKLKEIADVDDEAADAVLNLVQDTFAHYGKMAIYKCLPGYTVGGEPGAGDLVFAECMGDGSFNVPPEDMQCRNVNDCEQETCGPNGHCIDLIGEAPAFTCRCDEGFDLRKRKNGDSYCGNTDDCKEQDCGNGVCKDLVGDYTCSCFSGHHIGEKDGKKTCLPNQCSSDTPSVDNGKQKTSHKGAIVFPTTLQYKCNEGYSTDGSLSEGKRKFSVQCKSDSQLLGMAKCQKVNCGTATVLPYTKVIEPKDATRAILYKEEVEYKCAEGYTLKGKKDGKTEFKVKCKKNGKLTDPEVCEPVKCGDPPKFSKATAGITGDVSYGMTLDYMCDSGYTEDGTVDGKISFSIACQKNGKYEDLPWSGKKSEPTVCADAEGDDCACNGNVYFGKRREGPAPGQGKLYTFEGLKEGGHKKKSVSGSIMCSSDAFGGDPAEGYFKYCFCEQTEKKPCSPVSAETPSIANAEMAEYAGESVRSISDVTRVYYPNGLEYYCHYGYSEDGSPNGNTKISAKVNSEGSIVPALPSECKLITYFIKGRVTDAKNNGPLKKAKVTFELLETGEKFEASTGGAGYFTILNVKPGEGQLRYENGDGYKPNDKPIEVTGDIARGGGADIKLTPKLRKGEWRAKLSRGKNVKEAPLQNFGKHGENGGLHFKTKQDNRCLDVPGNGDVYMGKCHGGKNQKFYFDGEHLKSKKNKNKCLDYHTGNNNVYMGKCHGGKNQKWYFDGKHLKTKHNNKCLDYNRGNRNVYMHKCHNGKNQKWYIEGPLQGQCQGDCDTDSDCAGVLKCFQRSSSDSQVPGCAKGGSGDKAKTDYCYLPEDAKEEAPLQNFASRGCSKSKPCGQCQGDCDKDSDCASGLKCFQRSSSSSQVPGCAKGGSGDKGTTDYCYLPPQDLDLYAKWATTKVFSGDKIATNNNIKGRLVRDTTDGKGPEVLFLTGADKCKSAGSAMKASRCDIRIVVKDTKSDWKDSNALVTLESQYGMQATLKFKDCMKGIGSGKGEHGNNGINKEWWHLATINGETDELTWQCDSGEERPKSWPSIQVCADKEGDVCKCNGQVYFGRKFKWQRGRRHGPTTSLDELKASPYKEKAVTGDVKCSNSGMGGDPAQGYAKYCYCNTEAPTCNWQCYLDRYGDLQDAFGKTNTDAAQHHYHEHGEKEKRDCTCGKKVEEGKKAESEFDGADAFDEGEWGEEGDWGEGGGLDFHGKKVHHKQSKAKLAGVSAHHSEAKPAPVAKVEAEESHHLQQKAEHNDSKALAAKPSLFQNSLHDLHDASSTASQTSEPAVQPQTWWGWLRAKAFGSSPSFIQDASTSKPALRTTRA